MAKAITLPVTPPPAEIELTLTRAEAELLYSLLLCIGGDPTGPRGLTDGIEKALREVGVGRYRSAICDGSIYLKR